MLSSLGVIQEKSSAWVVKGDRKSGKWVRLMQGAGVRDLWFPCCQIPSKHDATLSGAEGGCQADVGVGSSMDAAMIAKTLGEGPKVVSNAAESALEHHLGMTCDPVAGYAQVPFIERCAFTAQVRRGMTTA